ncbi:MULTISPECIES: NADPH:quinone oxidoreductase family protein [unclassified Mesobacillus]|uniref:quinone oxidoreductase family protein n=1 Tax=unclassified Mesobacillus TaxID=2675270 RepID=UPI00203F84A0|nr:MULTISPECIES: NADPH:quinone oxidoreductase family protein [unclassified Mesobacillus]MCM3121581.1 NADPH:quinone oxidoreductase family protein [Mesobacillus sp. MER 33]MCM3231545.1 NADPH:quinone oxidoreductase family protein [Mesobacillus sp. MER 48]
MKAIQFTEYGGPEVLQTVELDRPIPKGQQVLIEIHAIGVNYADTARREGQYVVPTKLPFLPGAEIAGVVIEAGDSVTNVKPGDRVVTLIESGGYAEYALADCRGLIPLQDNMDFEQAAALPLQGLSAYHILKTMGRLEKEETVLVHAAAGGVGTLAVQLAKLLGAGKVIATASNQEKLALAAELGADVLINYTEQGWEEKVLEATGGKGVDVALEMAGGEIFNKTLKCLATFGRLVIYGVASGEQSRFYPSSLMARNQSVIGFFLPQIMRKPALIQSSMAEMLRFISEGQLKLTIGGVYPLEQAAEVHRLLQSRQTKGKLILKP